MTKKRFIIIGDSNIEFIMQTQLLLPIYDNKKRLSLKECCDLLNGLYEENQYLKSHLNMEVRDDMKKEDEYVYVLDLIDKEIKETKKTFEDTNEWIGVFEEVNIHCQFANFTLPHTNIQIKCSDLEIYNKLKKTLREFSEEEGG